MSTALYRRYRPDRFEDVIGQDHVTVPLRTALSKDRVNHAYLFSGPRGCGKTTSARILARCLNCAQGPTSTPCGECPSCRDLATGGPGSLDVLEIDAASHGGVEDARGLRERATFAPVRDRYKILIIDEAHMVTSAGFNALLKIVEEPPEHLKFIFATTEPEKVIGTIRSRTHHYPFRLVPPEPLIAYLEQLCAAEATQVDPGVLPLVVRAGTGSVRDTLSVLDQLIAGAAEGRVDYGLAVNLLGFTPEALLDDVVDALAADDAQTVFSAVDRVVQSGQDPRRFVEDLLDRFRDLVIARAMPEQAQAVLHGVPEDQVRRLAAQSAQLSRAELSRLADITNEALSEMVGATSPRLHLELLMARLLLPASDETHRGLSARLEALERRLDYSGGSLPDGAPSPASASSPSAGVGPVPDQAASATPAGLSGAALARAAMRRPEAETAPTAQPADAASPAQAAPPAQAAEAPEPAPTPERTSQPEPASTPERARTAPGADAPGGEGTAAPQTSPAAQPAPEQPEASAEQPPSGSGGTGTHSVEMVRRAWPDILAALEDSSRLVWMLVKDNASVAGYDGRLLTIGFTQDGPRQSLLNRRGDQVLAEAVHRTLGIRPELDLILGGDGPRGGRRPKAEGRPTPAAASAPAPRTEPSSADDRRAQGGRQPQQETPAALSSAAPPQAPARQDAAVPQPQQPSPSQPSSFPETTPPAAPDPDAWGTPEESLPDWGGRPADSPEDPWADIPEFDPETDMEDSDGPEGWTPEDSPAGAEQTFGATGTTASAEEPEDGHGQDSAHRGHTGPAAADVRSAGPEPAQDPAAASPAGPASDDAPAAETGAPLPAYNPGPLVPEVEPSIPVFARPESELRAEFAARFGSLRPQGFDRASAADAGARPADTAAPSPEGPSSAEPSRDDTPDPGVPAPDHDEHCAAGDDPRALAARGGGHPASWFVPLLERMAEGGPAAPPVNEGPRTSGAGPAETAAPAPEARPSAADLSRPRPAGMHGGADAAGAAPSSGGDRPALDPRAAAVQAAREAARGRGPRPEPTAPGAAKPSVSWEDEVASDDDVRLEESGLVGRPVVERILGARLLEEIPNS